MNPLSKWRKRVPANIAIERNDAGVAFVCGAAPRLEGAQVGSMVITKLAAAGTHVQKDDVLVEFDPQAQMKDFLDKKSTYENLLSQVAQKTGGRRDRARKRRHGDETGGRRIETGATGSAEE